MDVFADNVVGPPGQITADYDFGETPVDQFFRFYGDSDGDRDVDGQDYGRFGLSFLKPSGDLGFRQSMDSDGDVDGQDYSRFVSNLMKTL